MGTEMGVGEIGWVGGVGEWEGFEGGEVSMG